MKQYVLEIILKAEDFQEAYRRADGLIKDSIDMDTDHEDHIVAWALHTEPSYIMKRELEAGEGGA